MNATAARTAAIITAAGESRRFGSPKLLVEFQGEPLIHATVRAVARSRVDEIVVVVDPAVPAIASALAGLPVRIAENGQAAAGLGTSIAAGVRALDPAAQAAVIVMGDQPMLPHQIIDQIVAAHHESGCAIVVPEYSGQRAPPVLFSRAVFPELLQLTGDHGARDVVGRDPTRVHVLAVAGPVPPDIDTMADLETLTGG